MLYKEVAELYEKLEKTPSRLSKTTILSDFLKKLKKEKNKEVIYLVQGRVFPNYDEREIGISNQLSIKATVKSMGVSSDSVVKLWKEKGDVGKAAEELCKRKKQKTLFHGGKLTAEKVISNIQTIAGLEGKGTVTKKIDLISELLASASPLESRYIIRTLMGDLKIGVGDGTLRDAIVESCFSPKDMKEKKELHELVQDAYDKANDFALVFDKACKGKRALEGVNLKPGHPVKAMLFLKAKDIDDAFKRLGKPAAFEYKYDGFRMLINKHGESISIFTRRLDNVTKQFPDVVKYVKEHVKANDFILDAEAVGYDHKTKKYRPFQYISQRIKRKYDIEKLEKELPIELNVFDIIYHNGKNLIHSPFKERRKIIEKLIKNKAYKIRTAKQLITSDKSKAEKFYKKALKEGQEGVMIKALDKPYKPGARVGYGMKLKPAENEFDLVITGAEYGTGKRAGWLTSYIVSCRNEDGKLFEIGKVSTGLKEKESEGVSFKELTRKLKKLIIEEKGRKVKIRPKIIVTVTYQNIQRSPKYSSGFALRFPRFTRLRPDRNVKDIATISEINSDYRRWEYA